MANFFEKVEFPWLKRSSSESILLLLRNGLACTEYFCPETQITGSQSSLALIYEGMGQRFVA